MGRAWDGNLNVMKIVFNKFNGIQPRTNVALKPDNMAKVAWNCDLRDGRLRPLKEALWVSDDYELVNADYSDADDSAEVKTFRFVHRVSGESILWFASEKEIADANIDASNEFRCIVSGYDVNASDPAYVMRYTNGSATDTAPFISDLIKSRLEAPTVEISADQNPAEFGIGKNAYTTFKQTWVDANGYESPLSPPSEILNYYDDGTLYDWLLVSQVGEIPIGALHRRLYKSLDDGTGAATYQFVIEQDAFNNTFPALTIHEADKNAGSVAPDVDNPPDSLGGIVSVYGGFYGGFNLLTKREVMFSEFDLPYAWPIGNRIATFDQTIVKLVSYGNNVLALTDDIPLVFTGTAPDMMSVASTATHAPCVSRRSVVQIGASVVFASDDGLYTIPISGESQVTNVSASLFDRRKWKDLHPETSFAVVHDNQIFIWFPDALDPALRSQRYIFADGLSAVTTHDELCEAAVVIPTRGVVMLRRS